MGDWQKFKCGLPKLPLLSPGVWPYHPGVNPFEQMKRSLAVALVLAGSGGAARSESRAVPAPDPWAAQQAILKRIVPPQFPARDFDVTKFGAVADGEILAITQTGCFVCDSITVDGGTSPVLGFVLDDTASPVHDHPEFQLFGDASVTPDTVTPGIYLLNLKVTVTDLADADPTWILFAAFDPADYPELDEEQFDAFIEGQNALAAEWVAANVPEPGTVLLLGGGVAALAARRRRRE